MKLIVIVSKANQHLVTWLMFVATHFCTEKKNRLFQQKYKVYYCNKLNYEEG